jgi:uncharacterized membrane protein
VAQSWREWYPIKQHGIDTTYGSLVATVVCLGVVFILLFISRFANFAHCLAQRVIRSRPLVFR